VNVTDSGLALEVCGASELSLVFEQAHSAGRVDEVIVTSRACHRLASFNGMLQYTLIESWPDPQPCKVGSFALSNSDYSEPELNSVICNYWGWKNPRRVLYRMDSPAGSTQGSAAWRGIAKCSAAVIWATRPPSPEPSAIRWVSRADSTRCAFPSTGCWRESSCRHRSTCSNRGGRADDPTAGAVAGVARIVDMTFSITWSSDARNAVQPL